MYNHIRPKYTLQIQQKMEENIRFLQKNHNKTEIDSGPKFTDWKLKIKQNKI